MLFAVIVDVATIAPDAFVERIELIAVPERVSEGVEIEDVAVNVDAVTSPPVKIPEPPTDNFRNGDVVPIPRLPAVFITICVTPADWNAI